MIAPPLTETAFLGQVLQVAEMFGWHAAHFRPALTGRGWRTPVQGDLGAGWPDLVLIRGNRLVFAELKTDKGKVSPNQETVLEVLRGLEWIGDREPTVRVEVWRPADFETIVETLR